MKRSSIFVLIVAVAAPVASADLELDAILAPDGPPIVGESIIQPVGWGSGAFTHWGARIVDPSGLYGGYIVAQVSGGPLDPNTAIYALRDDLADDFPGSNTLRRVEGYTEVTTTSGTITFEIADPLVFGPGGSPTLADYVGLRVQNVLAYLNGSGDTVYVYSREWVFTNWATPASLSISDPPTGNWTAWNNGWYMSNTVLGGGNWAGNPIPAPAAVLLGVMGVGMVGWLTRRARKAKT